MVDGSPTRQAEVGQLNNDPQRLQDWLREASNQLLVEKRRNSQLAAQLEAGQQQARVQQSRLWLLTQTVETLKAELRDLAADYAALEIALAATRRSNGNTPHPQPRVDEANK